MNAQAGNPYVRTGEDEKAVYASAIDRMASATNGAFVLVSAVGQSKTKIDKNKGRGVRRESRFYLADEDANKLNEKLKSAVVDKLITAISLAPKTDVFYDDEGKLTLKLGVRGNNVQMTIEEAEELISLLQENIATGPTAEEKTASTVDVERVATADEHGNVIFITFHAGRRSKTLPFTEESAKKFYDEVKMTVQDKVVTVGSDDPMDVLNG